MAHEAVRPSILFLSTHDNQKACMVNQQRNTSGLIVLVILSILHQSAAAVTIDMVLVGNPGNAPDTEVMSTDFTTGYGSVGYNYQIGKYEVTAGQYTEFLSAVAKADPNGLYNTDMGNTSNSVRGANIQRAGPPTNYVYGVAGDDWANRPVNYVSFWDAARFANWLHNGQPTGAQGPGTTEDGAYHDIGNQTLFGRNAGAKFFIPNEDEWYKAAYHDQTAGLAASYFDYPTGTNSVPGNDINETTNPGNNANYFTVPDGNYAISGPYHRTVAGEFELSDSPYGTFDQGGNVSEWNETVSFSSLRGQRGGSNSDFFYGGLRASFRRGFVPTFEQFRVGFRVASLIPEPSTLLLLGFGSLAALWRRRRQS
jgi:formylglycine-generating enzyme required for sulfatase activity